VTIEGTCLCGSVRYEVNGGLADAGNCHCSMCRKAHGAAFATYASVDPTNFTWVSGEHLVSFYEASPGACRMFCSICGSTIGGAENGRITSVTLGTIEGDPGIQPRSHIFVGSMAPWYEISDDLPQFEEWPPGDEWA
jgi:hypothetical protein